MFSVKYRTVFLSAALLISIQAPSFGQTGDDATVGGDEQLLDAPTSYAPKAGAEVEQTVVQQVQISPSAGRGKKPAAASLAPLPGGSAASSETVETVPAAQPAAPATSAAPATPTPNKKLAQVPIVPASGRGAVLIPRVKPGQPLPPYPKVPAPASTVTTKQLPVGAVPPPQPNAGPEDTSLFADLTGRSTLFRSGTALLRLRVVVPHNKQAIDSFMVYPYPVKPPVVKQPDGLPTSFKLIKGRIVETGYLNRQSGIKPIPTFGWRWEEAYNAGLRHAAAKVGMGEPHTFATYYPWSSEMVKWVLPECRRINAQEDERWERYQGVNTEYNEKRVDIEMQSVRDGLFPLKMKRLSNFGASTNLPPGNWWVVGTHKVPGLTYYWNMPVSVPPGSSTNVVLNERNALVIKGAW